MPVTRHFTGGSIIYFQGDASEEIFVLQNGRVSLLSNAMDSDEEIREEVRQGEFFGVRSTLGRYPREETAQALGKTTLISFSVNEFEEFILKNTRLIMKMLRVFSKQLRNIHREVRDILKVGAARDSAYELMNVAESFYRSGNFSHAVYAFKKYIEIYPSGPYVKRSRELCDMAARDQTYPIGYPPLEFIPGNSSPVHAPEVITSPGEAAPKGAGGTITDTFYEALNYFSQNNFKQAVHYYDLCLAWTRLQTEEENSLFSRAHYEKGRSLLKLGQLDSARNSFSNYLKKFPTGEYVKDSIFNLGIIAESQGVMDRARQLFHKVATMPPPDETTAEARKRLERLK